MAGEESVQAEWAEADAAAIRRAFDRAAECFPTSVSQFLDRSKAGQIELAKLVQWWGYFYAAVRDHGAGLAILGELVRAKDLDALRRLELADTDAALADMQKRYERLKGQLAAWQAEKGERAA